MTIAKELYPEYAVDELLTLIRDTEAPVSVMKQQQVASQYDVVWGGIRSVDRPKPPLRQMSVQAVLNWQDSIDIKYMSEAAGAYQIMEDTLRGIPVDRKKLFDERTQDTCAIALLEGRGLKDYLSGGMSLDKFTLALAKEWASFPIPQDMSVTRGNKTYHLKWGDSYYSGDTVGNKALIELELVQKVLFAARTKTPSPAPDALTDAEKLAVLWNDYQERITS